MNALTTYSSSQLRVFFQKKKNLPITAPKNKLFISGLPELLSKETKQDMLQNYFKTFGAIERIFMITDRSGFVTFVRLEDAMRAYELSNTLKNTETNKKLFPFHVDYAEDESERKIRVC